jgi:hypothetical protein
MSLHNYRFEVKHVLDSMISWAMPGLCGGEPEGLWEKNNQKL